MEIVCYFIKYFLTYFLIFFYLGSDISKTCLTDHFWLLQNKPQHLFFCEISPRGLNRRNTVLAPAVSMINGNMRIFFYFRDIFQVVNKPDAVNIAYTTGYLPLHTDLPYYRYQPGVCFSNDINFYVLNCS